MQLDEAGVTPGWTHVEGDRSINSKPGRGARRNKRLSEKRPPLHFENDASVYKNSLLMY